LPTATLFEYFRELRDNLTPEIQAKLNQLNKECIIAANIVARAADTVGFGSAINDWTQEQQTMDEIYNELERRMEDPELQERLRKIQKFQSVSPGEGLVTVKVRRRAPS
jgi:hypothetical protein